MPKHPEIQSYLKDISKELNGVDPKLKKSILQEIDGHLVEKIEDVKNKTKVTTVSSKKIKQILSEFGEPQEIALEYRRQLSEGSELTFKKKKLSKKEIILSIIAVGSLISLFTVLIMFPRGLFIVEGKVHIDYEGPWYQAISWKPDGNYSIIVGEGIQILKYDGEDLEYIASPSQIYYYDIAWHPSGSYALICGSNGCIYKYDGENLQNLSLNVDTDLFAIKFHPTGEYALTVGVDGIIGVVKGNESEYMYVPDSVIVNINFYDLAWNSDGTKALLVGYQPPFFTNGGILAFTPGNISILDGTFDVLSTPASISTCFSSLWVEEWQSFIVTANMGQLYIINENLSITKIPNPFSGIDPIIDAVWNPIEKRVILVGGLSGYDSVNGTYDLTTSTSVIYSTDGQTLFEIKRRKGPNFLCCEWNPKNDSVIILGSFGVVNKYEDGRITGMSLDH